MSSRDYQQQRLTHPTLCETSPACLVMPCSAWIHVLHVHMRAEQNTLHFLLRVCNLNKLQVVKNKSVKDFISSVHHRLLAGGSKVPSVFIRVILRYRIPLNTTHWRMTTAHWWMITWSGVEEIIYFWTWLISRRSREYLCSPNVSWERMLAWWRTAGRVHIENRPGRWVVVLWPLLAATDHLASSLTHHKPFISLKTHL